MAAAAGHYYGDGGRATKRQKTDSDGMATVLSFDSVYCIFHACGTSLSFSPRETRFFFHSIRDAKLACSQRKFVCLVMRNNHAIAENMISTSYKMRYIIHSI